LRDAHVQRQLAALEPDRDRVAGALPLGAPAGGLAALAGDAAPDALAAAVGAGSRLQIVDLHATPPVALPASPAPTSSTVIRCGTRAIMPRISGRSGSTWLWPMRPRPRARSVPRCLGLVPIDDFTWVTLSSAITRPRSGGA